MAVEACGTVVGMGRVVDMLAVGAVDIWAAGAAEVIAVGPMEEWVAVATSGRDARWVRNIAASCGFLPPDGRLRSRQSAIIDDFRAVFRSIERSLPVGEDIIVANVDRPNRER